MKVAIFSILKDLKVTGQPKKLNHNINTKGKESDAYITPDGKTLYFLPATTLKMVTLIFMFLQREEGGDWGKAKSLGNTININTTRIALI
jgi:hypothetical protein